MERLSQRHGDSNPHRGESDVNQEDSGEEIEESQPPLKWSGRTKTTPVRFLDTVMGAA